MTRDYAIARRGVNPSFSIPSILAVLSAIGSFMTGAFLGLVLAIAAIVLGVIGILVAFAPGKRGGLVSVFAVIAGLIGIIAAVFKLIF